jgi:ribose 5-phosphate isomerase B
MTNDPGNRTVAIASDHGGFGLKKHLAGRLSDWGYQVTDLGTDSEESVDYPDFAVKVAKEVAAGRHSIGILICGTGLGMSMTANRFPGIRAAVCTSAYMSRMARAHNDANVLCLGERVVGFGEAEHILETFLSEKFEEDRHQRRIGKIDSLTSGSE